MREIETVETSEAKYEKRDANLRAILLFGGGLVAMTLAALVGMWLMFNAFAGRELRRDPSPLAGARQASSAPKLQVDPAKEMAELRAAEEKLLNSYEWVNKEAGIARIPIRRAMALFADKAARGEGDTVNGHETTAE